MTPHSILPAIASNLLFILVFFFVTMSHQAWEDGFRKASAFLAVFALSFLGWGIYALTWYIR